MDRTTILWTLTAFFGATVAFGLARTLSKGTSGGVTFAIQLVTLVVIVGVIAVVMRRQG